MAPKMVLKGTAVPDFPSRVAKGVKMELEAEFRRLGTNLFNTETVSQLTGHMPLQFTLWRCLQEYDLIRKFKIPLPSLRNFLQHMERRYMPVPYHNSEHASDVVNATHLMIKSGLEKILTPLEIFAMLVSAGAHDMEHNGVNNTFHVNSMSPIAILYNNRSVLENHHCSAAWTLLQEDESNILQGLSHEEIVEFRHIFIQNILATDMTLRENPRCRPAHHSPPRRA